ncbi:MAG: TonB-dependent receptor [Reichenbachiella sp.]|uniref:TonB-dependent receptor n=1 Tax=Reichenbachiella sp. TaxID=2184521 RepID=UPI0032659259
MKNKLQKIRGAVCFIMLLLPLSLMAQETVTVSGTVTDENGDGLPGVSVVIKGTRKGAPTNVNGQFSFAVDKLPVQLVVSYVGYETQEVTATSASTPVKVTLEEGLSLNEVVVTGNRVKARTVLDSPVPMDNISVTELRGSGQPDIQRMLTFTVPSFNSQNQAISDATAHYDPADLRGLGPSRTLVLVNGKRKNQSAQVYLNRTPGKGEVGIDLKSIPTAAIERVEVLRDGASAIYGSDAIAGVINLILKDDVEYTSISANSGITSQGDGFNFGTDINSGMSFGSGGNINLTLGYYKQLTTDRGGEFDVLNNDAPTTAPDPTDLVSYPGGATDATYIQDLAVFDSYQDWAVENPDAGMTTGQPELEQVDLFVNISHPVGENSEFYSFHGMTRRTGKSFAYYRAPYWRRDVANSGLYSTRPEDFVGYQPTFETDIKDHINSLGFKLGLSENWIADISATYGSNRVDYNINNSVNRSYLAVYGTSPTSFYNGGYSLSNAIGNLDVSGQITDDIGVAVGLEYKKEFFRGYEGEALSYYGSGSDSFAGIKPDEAVDVTRNNVAAYAQVDYDVTDALLLSLAGRYEDFSDFGDNFSYKASGRYKIGTKGAIRASYSTGFRAPTLHQRYLTNTQYIIVATSNEPLLQGTLANDNPAVQALGVPDLFAETSVNLSAGVTYQLNRNFSASVDLYQINVDDRVLFSTQISTLDGDLDGSDAVEQILIDNNVVAAQFFVNAGDTKTQGVDVVLSYDSFDKFKATLGANFNTTSIDAISTPETLEDLGYSIFNSQEAGLITNSRPKSKIILGLSYEISDFVIGLTNTRFGEVTITPTPALGEAFEQVLSAKVVTDISLDYKLGNNLSLSAKVNNIFDVYQDATDASTGTTQAEKRFTYSSEVQQMGQFGTNFRLGFNYKF